jgi:hypothetical protein
MHGQYSEMIGKGKERKATTLSKRPNERMRLRASGDVSYYDLTKQIASSAKGTKAYDMPSLLLLAFPLSTQVFLFRIFLLYL